MNSPISHIPFGWRQIRRVIWLILGLGILAYIVPRLLVFFALSAAIYSQGFDHYALANHRGDELSITTNVRHDAPYVTIVTLRRPWHWSSTTLVKVVSSSLSFHLKWLDDDHAEVHFHVDKGGTMGTSIAKVGPVRVNYFFDRDFKSK